MLSAIYETPFPKLVLVEDTVKLCGQNLFLSLVSTQSSKNSVKLLCLEKPPSYYKEKLKDVDNIHLHDCFHNFDGLNEVFEETSKSSTNTVIVIDSLAECYILMKDFFTQLRKLLSNKFITQIITLLHRDCVPSKNVLVDLHHISNAIIEITDGNSNSNTCSLLIRRPGRKVIKDTISCWVDENRMLHSKKFTPVVKKLADNQDTLPSGLSTFRIELNENEKKSRDQVVLPYTQIGAGDSVLSSGTGKIIYELEAADDWDEEDPDDDLDI